MDIPGQFDNPKFHTAVDSLVEACKNHGKTPGFLAGDAKSFGGLLAAYGALRYGSPNWPLPQDVLGIMSTAVMTFLSSEDASYLTGTTVDINGGSHIH